MYEVVDEVGSPEPGAAPPAPPVQPGSPAPPVSLRATLAFGLDVVSATFEGMRPLPSAPAATAAIHHTAAPDLPPPGAVAPVCLGAGPEGFLFVDLALAPGVITVSGQRRIREEVGAELVNRLGSAIHGGRARRVAVVVAGEPFPPGLAVVEPLRVASAAAFEPGRLPSDVEVCFLVSALQTAADATVISTLMGRPRPRVVPIVVDDVEAAAWALHALRPPRVR